MRFAQFWLANDVTKNLKFKILMLQNSGSYML